MPLLALHATHLSCSEPYCHASTHVWLYWSAGVDIWCQTREGQRSQGIHERWSSSCHPGQPFHLLLCCLITLFQFYSDQDWLLPVATTVCFYTLLHVMSRTSLTNLIQWKSKARRHVQEATWHGKELPRSELARRTQRGGRQDGIGATHLMEEENAIESCLTPLWTSPLRWRMSRRKLRSRTSPCQSHLY